MKPPFLPILTLAIATSVFSGCTPPPPTPPPQPPSELEKMKDLRFEMEDQLSAIKIEPVTFTDVSERELLHFLAFEVPKKAGKEGLFTSLLTPPTFTPLDERNITYEFPATTLTDALDDFCFSRALTWQIVIEDSGSKPSLLITPQGQVLADPSNLEETLPATNSTTN